MPQDRARAPFPSNAQAPTSDSDPSGGANRSGALGAGTYFLGRYRVVDEIGVGGMASVHLARMDGPGGFQKWVAIKRIHPHLVEDESFVNMFLDEARVAARISHPNVATVFELGKHEDTYWIAMEYLHGEPLREVMRRTEELGQPMPPEIACRVIADAAEGLHSAHELLGKNGEKLGLVHRDVTPHNLFVTYDGSTKVVDFGIAKFSSRMANTRAGTLKGKLAYMSPEQVAGEPIDRRTDVFALGVVLWELTTGQRLFRMESDLDTLAKVQECNVPRPSTIVRGYPIDLEKIVMKALAKTKNERYRTSREFSRALQSLLMRRGLFIASDEVASYMTSVFGDRIQKREAHLRWAAEVTQTVDIDQIKNGGLPASPWKGEDGSILTYNSEVQASQPSTARAAPRPAAGMPASQERPTAGPPPTARAAGLKATLGLGAPIAHSPLPVPRPASLPQPVDPLRSEDPPTLARPRTSEERGQFDDDFDDIGDTIVTDSMPDIPDLPETADARDGHVTGARAHRHPGRLSGRDGGRDGPDGGAAPSAHPPADAGGPRAAPAASAGRHADGDRGGIAPRVPAAAAAPKPLQRVSGGADAPLALRDGEPRGHAAAVRASGPQRAADGDGAGAQAPNPGMGRRGRLRGRRPRGLRAGGRHPLDRDAAATRALGRGICSTFLARDVAGRACRRPGLGVGSLRLGPRGVQRCGRRGVRAGADERRHCARAHGQSAAFAAPQAIPTTNIASLPIAPARPVAHPAPAVAVTPPSTTAAGNGTLKVICFPGCDQVIDNGSALGPSPIIRRTASVGSHRLKLVWSDASKVVSTVVIADQTATVRENHP